MTQSDHFYLKQLLKLQGGVDLKGEFTGRV